MSNPLSEHKTHAHAQIKSSRTNKIPRSYKSERSAAMTDCTFMRELCEALQGSVPKVLWMVAEYVNDYNEEQKQRSVRGG